MELFQLFGTIAINNALANKEIDETTDKAEKSSGKIGAAFKKIGTLTVKAMTAATAAAATGIAAITKAAVSGFGDYEQLVGGVETLFKDSAGKVQTYADNAYKTAGLSANKYMETVTSFSASLLQGLGGDTAKAADIADLAITDMADNANKMGTSMESIQDAYQGFAKQNYTMLDNLKLGYGGTQTEMIRLINDSGILKEKIDSLDNVTFDQMILAIHEIQNNLGITGTTALEASTTIQGSIASAKSAWENFLVGLAAGDQDMKQLTQNLGNSILTVGDNLIPRIQTTLESIGTLIETIVPPILQKLPSMLMQILPSLLSSAVSMVKAIGSTLLTALQNNLPQMMQSGANLINKLGEGIKNNLPNLINRALDIILNLTTILKDNAPQLIQSGLNLIVNLAKGLMDSLPSLIAKVPTIVSNIASIINDNAPKLLATAGKLILTLAKGLIQAIPTLVSNIPKIIKAVVDVLLAFNWLKIGKQIITFLKNGIVGAIGFVKTAGTKVKDTIVNVIKTLPKRLFDLGKQAISKLVSIIKHTANLKSAANAIVTEIAGVIGKLPGKMLSIGKNLVKGLWNGIGNVKDWVLSKIKGFGKSILDGIKSFFGIHSPSTVMEKQVGKNLALGVVSGLEKSKKAVLNASKKNLGKSIANGLVSGIETAKANAKKKSSEISALIIKEAKRRLEAGKTYKKMNLVDEVEYWDAVRKQCKKGSAAKLEADKQYLAAKKKLAKEQKKIEDELVEKAEKRLERYKTYNNLSIADEMAYWDQIRKTAKKGSEARVEADKKYYEAHESYMKQLAEAERTYADAIEAANQKIVDRTNEILSAFSLFDEFKQEIDDENPLTGDKLINNLQTQVDALTEYETNMSTLKDKIGDTDLFKAIQDMGVNSLQQVKAINSMTEDQLQKYVELYNQRQQQAKDQATEELGSEVLADIEAAMNNYQQTLDSMQTTTKKKFSSISKTIKEKTSAAAEATVETLKTMMDSFKSKTGSMSSTVSEKFSQILNNIKSKMNSAAQSVKNAVQEMQNALSSVDGVQSTDASPKSKNTKKATKTISKHAAGGILTEPTIFGYSPKSGTYHLGGEAGAEAIAPIDVLLGYIRQAVSEQNGELVAVLKAILQAILDKDTKVYLNSKEISKAVNKDLGVIY